MVRIELELSFELDKFLLSRAREGGYLGKDGAKEKVRARRFERELPPLMVANGVFDEGKRRMETPPLTLAVAINEGDDGGPG
ncbi:hypothetical protein VNO77_42215 [Canavalia gladiata]|uniref:Uncharacterized protein n=1 Tax=Canavalia gladiata TaxID=3824 RepID=A0AAN9K2A6_CANGL